MLLFFRACVVFLLLTLVLHTTIYPALAIIIVLSLCSIRSWCYEYNIGKKKIANEVGAIHLLRLRAIKNGRKGKVLSTLIRPYFFLVLCADPFYHSYHPVVKHEVSTYLSSIIIHSFFAASGAHGFRKIGEKENGWAWIRNKR